MKRGIIARRVLGTPAEFEIGNLEYLAGEQQFVLQELEKYALHSYEE